MRVLDLDLDALLCEVQNLRPVGVRPTLEEAPPWSEREVVQFLEQRCGLSREEPIDGYVVANHDEVLDLWLRGLDSGRLVGKLDVVHVDAHADLGLGDSGYVYLLTSLLHRPMADRAAHMRPTHRVGLRQGNYLAYAAACGILESITYVHPPMDDDDVYPFLFRGRSAKPTVLELPCFPEGTPANAIYEALVAPQSVEPPVSFSSVTLEDFRNDRPFEVAYLSTSPDYVPEEAETLLMDILLDYVQL